MVTLYVFCLVLGGGFLGVSLLGDLFGGGDVGDVAIDGDVSLDFDGHVDVDVDMDAHIDVDSHIDIDTDAGHAAHAVRACADQHRAGGGADRAATVAVFRVGG